MTRKQTGRETVAAADEKAGWTLILDPHSLIDHYLLGRMNVFVSFSVGGAVTTASTPNGLIGAHLTGKAGRVADFLRAAAQR